MNGLSVGRTWDYTHLGPPTRRRPRGRGNGSRRSTCGTGLLIRTAAPYTKAGAAYAQRNLLFRNGGFGRFVEAGRSGGDGFAREKVSRGLAAGDIDNDGDLDLLVTNNGQTAELLRNDSRGGNALLVRVVSGNRDAVGARVRVTAGRPNAGARGAGRLELLL